MSEQEKAVRKNNAFAIRRQDSRQAMVDSPPVNRRQVIDVSVHVNHDETVSQSLTANLSVRAGMVAGLVYSLVEHVVTSLNTVVEKANAKSATKVTVEDVRRQVVGVVPTILSVRELTVLGCVDEDVAQLTTDVDQVLDVLQAVIFDQDQSRSVEDAVELLGVAMSYLVSVSASMKRKVTPEIANFVRGTINIIEDKVERAGPFSIGKVVVSRPL